MKRSLLCSALFVSYSGFSATAWAHPGHAVEVVSTNSALHPFLQPEHAILWVAVGLVLVVVARTLQAWLSSGERQSERIL